MHWTHAATETLKRTAAQVAPLTFFALVDRAEALARRDYLTRPNAEYGVVNADHLRRAHRELRHAS